MSTCRTFIAIELPASIRQDIRQHIDRLRQAFPDVRASWSREDNLHLTLKFLGDVSVSLIPTLSAACAQASRQLEPFELVVKGSGIFPTHGRPKVLWVGVQGKEPDSASASVALTDDSQSPLMLLHASVEEACAAAGFAREPRPYHPHLTIARLRESKDAPGLAEQHRQIGFPPRAFTVSEIVLFRSELSSKGSKHTALSRHQLGPARS
jgi:2'-5' RNA ligase